MNEYIFSGYGMTLPILMGVFSLIIFATWLVFRRKMSTETNVSLLLLGAFFFAFSLFGIPIYLEAADDYRSHQAARAYLIENKSVFTLSSWRDRKKGKPPLLSSDYETCKKLADLLNDFNAIDVNASPYDCDLSQLGEYPGSD